MKQIPGWALLMTVLGAAIAAAVVVGFAFQSQATYNLQVEVHRATRAECVTQQRSRDDLRQTLRRAEALIPPQDHNQPLDLLLTDLLKTLQPVHCPRS